MSSASRRRDLQATIPAHQRPESLLQDQTAVPSVEGWAERPPPLAWGSCVYLGVGGSDLGPASGPPPALGRPQNSAQCWGRSRPLPGCQRVRIRCRTMQSPVKPAAVTQAQTLPAP
ncbi:hypothetical protein R6Z07F_019048 [Ovis aries]